MRAIMQGRFLSYQINHKSPRPLLEAAIVIASHSPDASTPGTTNMAASDSPPQSKNEATFASSDNGVQVAETEFREEVGGLHFDQYLAGGMGRHLGIFSTTSLMFDLTISPPSLPPEAPSH